MDDRRRGSLLVAAQLTCAAALLLPGRRLWRDRAGVRATASVLVAVGAALALAGAAGLGRRLRALPEPPPDAVLRTGGVYARVRHPIYVGLVTTAVGVAVARARTSSWIAAGALTAVLRTKSRHEDAALARRFGAAYEDYRRRTPGWLPSRPRR